MRRVLRGVIVLCCVAAAGGVGARGGGTSVGLPGVTVFSSDRAPNLIPQLISVGSDGTARTQLTAFDRWASSIVPSPDGSHIAYFLDSTLMAADADGSTAVQLTDGTGGAGNPVWSPDGTRLAFVWNGSLYVVAASGGTPQKLAVVASWTLPAWSPDGASIAFAGGSYDSPELDAVTVADGQIRKIVSTIYFPGAIAWSRDGKRLAYTFNGLWVVNADGTGSSRISTIYADQPAFSPDGTRIAFAGYGDGGWEIYTVTVDGAPAVRLTTNDDYDASPAWSPDGTHVADARMAGSYGSGGGEVVSIAADGSGEQVVGHEDPRTVIDGGPWWTPDGTRLLVADHLASNDRELYSATAAGQPVHQLTFNTIDDADPAISPDGRLIAFDRGDPGKTQALFTMRIDGKGLHRLTSNRFTADVQPSWAPDGSRIVFASNRSGTFHLYVIGAAGGHVRRLTVGRSVDTQPAWSPDGAWIAFTSTNPDTSTSQIWAVRPDGSGAHRIDHSTDASAPAWSPQGSRLAYIAQQPGSNQEDGLSDLFLDDGTTASDVAANVKSRPAWTLDGTRIVFSNGWQLVTVTPDGKNFLAATTGVPGTSDEPAVQRRCDITGTPGNDTIVGTYADELICGLGGNDTIRGMGGNDVLLGGAGNDTLIGGLGRDLLFGGDGNDTLFGRDASRDVLDGGPGRDTAHGDRHDVKRSDER